MRRPIRNGETVELYAIGTNMATRFTIREVVGMGATCIVYTAEYCDMEENQFRVRIKEFYPIDLVDFRDAENYLVVEENVDMFRKKLKRFELGYQRQLAMRLYDDMANTISNIQGIYEGNGTKYIIMSYHNGLTYSDVKDENLYDILQIALAVTKALSSYHDKGFLHLDLKPENIYKLVETNEVVQLFDFDSIVLMEELDKGKDCLLSYTQKWAAPELRMMDTKSICRATDLYSIGAMVFYKVFHRIPDENDRSRYAKWQYDNSNYVFQNVNPKVIPVLTDLFHKTLQASPKARFQTTKELKQLIEEALILADPQKPYLKTSIAFGNDYFIGRKDELEEIHRCLTGGAKAVFLSGIGGTGKSTLAKRYAKEYINSYDNIIAAFYHESIVSMIIDDQCVPIHHFERGKEEGEQDYFKRKLHKLRELVDSRTLLIVDNFNTYEDETLEEVLKLNWNILFTSRMDFSDYGYQQIYVEALKDKAEQEKLFYHYYKKPVTQLEQQSIQSIIECIDGHTMSIELIAKQMTASRIKPENMYHKLLQAGVRGVGKEKVRLNKDGELYNDNTFNQIKTIFDMSELTKKQRYLLINLCPIPYVGISTEIFFDWCGLESYDDINELVDSGWIRYEERNDYISLHPIISDVIYENCQPKVSDVESLLSSIVRATKDEIIIQCESFEEKEYRKNLMVNALKYFNEGHMLIADLFDNLGDYEYNYGKYKSALERFQKAYEIKQSVETSSERDIAISLKNFSCVYLEMSQIEEAIDYGNKAIELLLSCNNKDNELLADNYQDMGVCYEEAEEYDVALQYYQKALELYSRDSENNRNVANVYRDMGTNRLGAGQLQEAFDYATKALEIADNIMSDYDKDKAIILNAMGNYYYIMNQYSKALEYALKSLEIRKRVCGTDSIMVARMMDNVSAIYYEMGLYKEALDYSFTALDLRNRLYNEENIEFMVVYNHLGKIYCDLEDYNKALSYNEMALNICKDILDEKSRNAARIYTSRAYMYYKKKQHNEAIEWLNRSYNIYVELEGLVGFSLIRVYTLYMQIFVDKKENGEANKYYKYAMELAVMHKHEESLKSLKVIFDSIG